VFGQAEAVAGIVLQPLLVHLVYVEWWICHAKVELARTFVDVLVVGHALPDVASESVDGEVHLAKPDGLSNFLLAVDRDVCNTFLVVVYKRCRLDEHAARSARRVVDASVVRLDDFHDQLDDAGRREELTTLLPFRHGELAEKVFVYLPERIAFNVHRG